MCTLFAVRGWMLPVDFLPSRWTILFMPPRVPISTDNFKWDPLRGFVYKNVIEWTRFWDGMKTSV